MASKITPNQTFLHGEDRYEAGEEYEVTPALAALFVNNGWADSDSLSAKSPQAVLRSPDLDVHDADQTTATEGL